jgi:hypothetical protein
MSIETCARLLCIETMVDKGDVKNYGLATNATVEMTQLRTPTQSLLIDRIICLGLNARASQH